MDPWLLGTAAALLSIERVAYIVIWRDPRGFRRWAARPPIAQLGSPIDVLAWLFAFFKLLQVAVFVGWLFASGHGNLRPQSTDMRVLVAGGLLVSAGQYLNLLVFRRLGKVGVFYGNRFGQPIPWCSRFPFTWFDHPQYVGTVIAIWGFFFLMRFPAADWLAIPMLETIYYVAGAHFEGEA